MVSWSQAVWGSRVVPSDIRKVEIGPPARNASIHGSGADGGCGGCGGENGGGVAGQSATAAVAVRVSTGTVCVAMRAQVQAI